VLAEFHRRQPGIELHLEIANTQHIKQALLDGSIELGFTEGPVAGEHLETTVFFQDELVAVAATGHPLLAKSRVSVRELCREPFLLREEGSGTRAVVERALDRKGIKIKPVLSLASPEAIKHAVAVGLGIAILSRLTIALELQAGVLGVIPLQDLTIHRPLHFQRLRNRGASPALEKFLAALHTLRPPPVPERQPPVVRPK
jgi:DNA-binding transcriptional LysR family regulator